MNINYQFCRLLQQKSRCSNCKLFSSLWSPWSTERSISVASLTGKKRLNGSTRSNLSWSLAFVKIAEGHSFWRSQRPCSLASMWKSSMESKQIVLITRSSLGKNTLKNALALDRLTMDFLIPPSNALKSDALNDDKSPNRPSVPPAVLCHG